MKELPKDYETITIMVGLIIITALITFVVLNMVFSSLNNSVHTQESIIEYQFPNETKIALDFKPINQFPDEARVGVYFDSTKKPTFNLNITNIIIQGAKWRLDLLNETAYFIRFIDDDLNYQYNLCMSIKGIFVYQLQHDRYLCDLSKITLQNTPNVGNR